MNGVTFLVHRYRAMAVAVAVLAGFGLVACSPAPPAPVAGPGGFHEIAPDEYTVESGDTLFSIAWRYGLDHRDIAAWNGIDNASLIYPGQTLRMSTPKNAKPRTKTTLKKAPEKADKPAQSRPKQAPARAAQKPSSRISQAAPAGWKWPANGKVLRGSHGNRRALTIVGTPGQKIVSAAAGKVVYSGSGLRGYGRLIIVKHNSNYLSAYGHNRRLLVREGDQLKAGQTIAEMGESDSGQPGLHFEIRRNGKPVDAIPLLPRK